MKSTALLYSDGFATLVVAVSAFTDTFLYDVVIPFLPQMLRNRLGMPDDSIQRWTSTALAVFGAASVVSTVLVAFATDRFSSTRSLYFGGLLVLVAAVLMLFLGETIGWIIAARALQGLSTALLWVSGLSFLTNHINASYVGTAMGYVTFGLSFGELMGPIAGGVLYELAGLQAVLGLTLGILGLDGVLRILLRSKPAGADNHEPSETDPLVGNESSRDGQQSASAMEAARSSNEQIEDRKHRSFRDYLKSGRMAFWLNVGFSWFAVFIVGIIRSGLESTIPIYVAQRFGWSTSKGGGVLFALLVPTVISPIVGKIIEKRGPRWPSVIFFITDAAGFVGLPFLHQNKTSVQVGFVLVVLVIGISQAILTTSHTVAFGWASKKSEIDGIGGGGKIFGSMTISWAVSTFAGPLIADAVLESLNWQAYCFLSAAICILAAAVMTFSWRNWQPL